MKGFSSHMYLRLVPLSGVGVVLEHVHHGLPGCTYERRVHLPPVHLFDLFRSVLQVIENIQGGDTSTAFRGEGGTAENLQ